MVNIGFRTIDLCYNCWISSTELFIDEHPTATEDIGALHYIKLCVCLFYRLVK